MGNKTDNDMVPPSGMRLLTDQERAEIADMREGDQESERNPTIPGEEERLALRTSSDLTFQHNLRSIRLTEAA